MSFDNLLDVIQVISKSIQENAAIAVADQNQFVYYRPGREIDLPIHPGDNLRQGTASYQALQLRNKLSMSVDPQVFGVPYLADSYPILESNEMKGCITTIYPLKKTLNDSQQTPLRFLIGKTEDRYIPVSFGDIQFIYSESGKTVIQAKGTTYQNKFTLGQLEYLLPSEFMRCHRSYIVNINHITEIHPHFHSTFQLVIKDSKTRVPVGQTYASIFRHTLGF